MAAAAAAALLDELMGRNRNVLPNEKPKEINWEDSEVRHLHTSQITKSNPSTRSSPILDFFNAFILQHAHLVFLYN